MKTFQLLVKGKQRLASQQSEQRAVAKFGGRQQLASGALRHSKGDILTDTHLIEDKITSASSFGVSVRLWEKLRKEAFQHRREPMLRITIGVDPSGNGRTLCVVDEDYLRNLLSK